MRLGKRKRTEVALSIRKRHFQNLLDEYRQTRRDIIAARRSRQRRARLLRLARRHGLSICLDKLRPKGMTLQAGNDQTPYITYDNRVTRVHLAALRKHCEEIREEWNRLKAESVKPIAANLKTLFEETELVSDKPMKVRWIVDNVVLEGVWIGDIEVTMDLDKFDVHAWNKSVDTDEKNGYQHPHVASDGQICWNGHDEDARAFHQAGDFLALKDMIENLLRTYNSHSPYITLEDWENGFGESCSGCGERCDDDDLAYSDRFGESLCPNCRCYCEECEDYVPEEYYNSQMEACDRCVEEGSDVCALCLERFWRRDIKTIEMLVDGKKETVPCCETCKEEYEAEQESKAHEEEENDNEPERDDHPDGERLLEAGVALSQNAQ